jgi:hypothetical protein
MLCLGRNFSEALLPHVTFRYTNYSRESGFVKQSFKTGVPKQELGNEIKK